MPKKGKPNYTVLAVVGILVGIGLAMIAQNPTQQTSEKNLSDLSLVGYVQVSPNATVAGVNGIINLTGNCYNVVGNTDAVQAQSIIDGIAGKIRERPGTHDLVKDAFQNFGIKVLMVKVVGLQNNHFIGRLILQQGSTILSLDSRPSDGIALAVRMNSKIYFKEDLLKQHGEKVC